MLIKVRECGETYKLTNIKRKETEKIVKIKKGSKISINEEKKEIIKFFKELHDDEEWGKIERKTKGANIKIVTTKFLRADGELLEELLMILIMLPNVLIDIINEYTEEPMIITKMYYKGGIDKVKKNEVGECTKVKIENNGNIIEFHDNGVIIIHRNQMKMYMTKEPIKKIFKNIINTEEITINNISKNILRTEDIIDKINNMIIYGYSNGDVEILIKKMKEIKMDTFIDDKTNTSMYHIIQHVIKNEEEIVKRMKE